MVPRSPYSSLLIPGGCSKKSGEGLIARAFSERTRADGFKHKEDGFR